MAEARASRPTNMMSMATTISISENPASDFFGNASLITRKRLLDVLTRTAAVPPDFDSSRAAENRDGARRVAGLLRVVKVERETSILLGRVNDGAIGLKSDVEFIVCERGQGGVVTERGR